MPISNKSKLEKLESQGISEVTGTALVPHNTVNKTKGIKIEAEDRLVVYDGEIDIQKDNERLRAHIQGMQCRVVELEKACKKMQNQMTKIMKSRSSTSCNVRSLPKLCS